VIKAIWQKGRIAAVHGRFNSIRQVAPMCTPSNTCFHGPPEPIPQMASQSVQRLLNSSRQGVPILYNGLPLPPSKLPICMEDLNPHLIHGSLIQPESTTQTASRSVQPFLQGSWSWQTDRQTDDATSSATIGRIYIVLWCDLIMTMKIITSTNRLAYTNILTQVAQ